MYAIQCALGATGAAQSEPESADLLRGVLDDMRERRAQLRLRRHNGHGF